MRRASNETANRRHPRSRHVPAVTPSGAVEKAPRETVANPRCHSPQLGTHTHLGQVLLLGEPVYLAVRDDANTGRLSDARNL